MTRVAVLGSSGFVGTHVCQALEDRGHEVVAVRPPRLTTQARDLRGIGDELERAEITEWMQQLSTALRGCEAVVNAAGVADPTGKGDALFGANALLPVVVARAVPPGCRFVHVSSAAVQGRSEVLDESRTTSPFSQYSESKALGEMSLRAFADGVVVYRPTSVHGSQRAVTRSLLRVLKSRLSSVASGDCPTPQVLAVNVGDAAAFLATCDDDPPAIVLHPWEGLTTRELAQVLGRRKPLTVPAPVARFLIGVGHVVGSRSSKTAGLVRRVEILWFGQAQAPGWLTSRWTPPVGVEGWKDLA